jgi:flagellar FliJ protein
MEFMDKQVEGINAMELRIYTDFFSRKVRDIKAQRQNVTCLDEKVSEKRDVLLEAAIDKKVIERLKEKKIMSHENELAAKERAFFDEMALRKRERDSR